MLENNPIQQKAIEYEGNLLIKAGPGTGKTETVARKICHFIGVKGYKTSEILALTFSQKAAMELRTRVDSLLNASYDELWISTFHSFCRRVIIESGKGKSENGVLLTRFQEWLVMRDILSGMKLVQYPALEDSNKFAVDVLGFIGLLKQNLIDSGRFIKIAEGTPRLEELAQIYKRYQTRLESLGFLDFKDLIMLAYNILKNDEKVRNYYQNKFRLIIIDEFQDTDPAQFELIRLLAGVNTQVCAVGDPWQSIYRFRGATSANIDTHLPETFKPEIIALESNYRSLDNILTAAQNVIVTMGDNETKLPRSDKFSDEPVISICSEKDEISEARWIARKILRLVSHGRKKWVREGESDRFKYSDFAILCRSVVSGGKVFEDIFSLSGIPYKIPGGSMFYMNPIVARLMNFLRAVDCPSENILLKILPAPPANVDYFHLTHILSVENTDDAEDKIPDMDWESEDNPVEILTDGVPNNIESLEAELGKGVFRILNNLDKVPVPEGEIIKIRNFLGVISGCRRKFREDTRTPLYSHIFNCAERLGLFTEIIKKSDNPTTLNQAKADMANLTKFLQMVQDIEQVRAGNAERKMENFRLSDFIGVMDEAVQRFSDEAEIPPEQDDTDTVKIMTLHQSKGLEFPVVFIPHLVAGVFPVPSRGMELLDQDELDVILDSESGFNLPYSNNPDEHIREECRLFYVGMTRAKERLFLSYYRKDASGETVEPSGFLSTPLGGKSVNLNNCTENGIIYHSMEEAREPDILIPDERLAVIRRAIQHVRKMHPLQLSDLERRLDKFVLNDRDRKFVLEVNPFERDANGIIRLPKDFIFSASAINAYLKCPRRFFYQNILKPVTPGNYYSNLGNTIHSVVEKLCREYPLFDAAESELQNFADSYLKNEFDNKISPNLEGDLQRTFLFDNAKVYIDRFIQTEKEKRTPGTISEYIEDWTSFKIGEYKFISRIDRIDRYPDGTIEVIDYKTTKSPIDTANALRKNIIDKTEDFQLPLYAFAYHSRFGKLPDYLSYYMIRKSLKDKTRKLVLDLSKSSTLPPERVDWTSVYFSPEDLSLVQSVIINIADTLVNTGVSDFNQNHGYFECGKCSYGFLCGQESDGDSEE